MNGHAAFGRPLRPGHWDVEASARSPPRPDCRATRSGQGSGNSEPLPGRIRRPGAGRKPLIRHDLSLVRDLEALVEPTTRGDPQSRLRWTCKSTRKLAAELRRQGHRIGPTKVAELLHDLHYSLQANRK